MENIMVREKMVSKIKMRLMLFWYEFTLNNEAVYIHPAMQINTLWSQSPKESVRNLSPTIQAI